MLLSRCYFALATPDPEGTVSVGDELLLVPSYYWYLGYANISVAIFLYIVKAKYGGLSKSARCGDDGDFLFRPLSTMCL